jgi:general nucleoside transport system permease protein
MRDRLLASGTAVTAAVLGVLLGLVAVAIAGASPFTALETILRESLGSSQAFSTTMQTAVPLAFAALGVTVAYKAGLFNIGGEGQLVLGALAANLAAVELAGVSPWLAVPVALLAGMAAGAAWAALAGVLRAYRDVGEIVSTIMLNFIAVGLVSYLVRGPLLEPGSSFPQTEEVPAAFELPAWGPVSLGVMLVIVSAVLSWFALYRTLPGLRLQSVGRNERAARVLGIPVRRIWVVAFALAGLFMGLAGALELLQVQHKVSPGFSPGYGFTGLLVAFLGRAHPLGVLPAAVFMAVLETGGGAIERQLNVASVTVFIMQALAAMMAVGLPYILDRLRGWRSGRLAGA